MSQIDLRYQEIPLNELEYFLPERTLDDIPEEYYRKLKNGVELLGIRRPLLVCIHVNRDFQISRKIIQDGFVRWKICQELNIDPIPCECKIFFPDTEKEIRVLELEVSIDQLECGTESDLGTVGVIDCFQELTDDEDGNWVHGPIKVRDTGTYWACKKAGLEQVKVTVSLLDHRE